jgi:hypothetical protein
MHVLGRKKGALIVAMLAAIICAASPSLLAAKPAPGYTSSGFRLFTRASFRWVGNRTQCFLSNQGQICTSESSVTGGGYWPAGTNNQYIFNTGLQIAGQVDPASVGNPWAGDIEGAFFFNARGGGNGQSITDIYNSADPADLANWPAAAYVPAGTDQAANLFDPALQGQKTASDNDIWFLSWEGDPSLSSGRGHPLGILVETRGLAYNTPGKNDFLFFIYTFYNVTASDPAVYAAAPARIRPFLENAGALFNSLNAARGSNLPTGGYTITNMFLAIGADNDVTFEESGTNYASVNVPMSVGYTYHASFAAPSSWTFDPTIYRAPFFNGSGFIGLKYLKSPEINGVEVGLTLFGSTSNGGQFSDPRNTQALFRYLTGTVDPAQGDDVCNVGNVQLTKICYINQGNAADMRTFQASGPLTLGPGESSTVAAAYIFAPPVAVGACVAADACGQVRPQNPTGSLLKLFSPDSLVNGVNTVDSVTGYRGYLGDRGPNNGPADGLFNTYDLDVVPGSLLGKSQVAQEIFDKKFVQPSPPKAPNFFLIPGDRQITVVWQPSITETEGDPFTSGSDPNYRQFDVAGYRIYRGNRQDEQSLVMLAQFDHQGDVMYDVTGQVNQLDALGFSDCAPDLGVYTSCTAAGTSPGGVNLIDSIAVTLDGPVIQWQDIIPSGTRSYATKADTAVTGGGSGRPGLSGSGVPFIFVDRAGNCTRCGVNNGQNYYYIVSAFDINSVRSGPSSLESNLSGARRVVAQPSPSNVSSSGTQNPVQVAGRSGPLPAGTVPTIDATTGRFSGPFPPANAAGISLAAFLPQVLPASGAVTVTLDSIALGDPSVGIPHIYYWHSGTFAFSTTVAQDFTEPSVSASALYDAVQLDPTLAARYGGGAGYKLLGGLNQTVIGAYYASIYGRGCVNSATGFVPAADQGGCDYNGPRWFNGPSPTNNETKADPIAGNAQNFTAPFTVDRTQPNNAGYNNGGELTGVDVIHQAYSYQTMGNQYRDPEGVISGAKRAADYNVYWSATTAGLIDSVIDVTHDVAVPFDSLKMGGSYGILTQALAQPSGTNLGFDRRTELTLTDFGCVEPMRTHPGPNLSSRIRCGATGGVDGPVYTMTRQASLGAIAHWTGSPTDSRTSPDVGTGFALYMPGSMFMFQTTALPQGVVWSLRDYVGAITGGNGFGGADGPYRYYEVLRPFTAVGASLQLSFTTTNSVAATTKKNLELVHTVPDPYYVTTRLENSSDSKIIKFVNLPNQAIIRIYSASGVLVRVLEHSSLTSSELTWDVRNRNGQFVASGVYFYHIEAIDARRIGRMTIVNFAK